MYHDSLTIGVRREPGYVLIAAAGEIDIFTVARLREQLFTLAGDGRPVIADLDRVTFLGAAGLGALAGWTAPCGSPAPGPKRSRPCQPPRPPGLPGRHSPSPPRSEVTTMTMTEPKFPVQITRGVPVVITPPEIDITNAGQLRAALLYAAARPGPAVVVDMTRTRFCDSAGLHALIGAHKRARAEGRQVKLAVTGAQVRRILALTALDRLIPVCTSLDQALAHPPAAGTRAAARERGRR